MLDEALIVKLEVLGAGLVSVETGSWFGAGLRTPELVSIRVGSIETGSWCGYG